MKKILCIVAGQRAGTTALQSAISSTDRFRNFREIFHNQDASGEAGSYFDFVRTSRLTIEEMSSHEGTDRVIGRYVDYLISRSEGRYPLIDVKLNSWNVIRPHWVYPHEQPYLMGHLKRIGSGFVQIVRRDLTSQILSEQIARRKSTWHNLSVDAEGDEAFEVDVDNARLQARLIVQAENLLHSYLCTYKDAFFVHYEDLYEDGQPTDGVKAYLRGSFDVELPSRIEMEIKPNKVEKRSIVLNYEEVDEVVKGVIEQFGRAF